MLDRHSDNAVRVFYDAQGCSLNLYNASQTLHNALATFYDALQTLHDALQCFVPRYIALQRLINML